MPIAQEIVLDIETNWHQEITVLGFRTWRGELVQLIGKEVTRTRFLKELPRSGTLFTYNGHCFDLPVIHKQLGVDLRERFQSHDLRFVCQRIGLTGGQKAVEERLGIRRKLKGLDGMDAIRLWREYERGDARALETLLAYNAEDLDGLRAIRRYLSKCGHFNEQEA